LVTASPEQDAAAAQAMAAGQAVEIKHMRDAAAQHRDLSGSQVAVEPASTPDDVAATTWPNPLDQPHSPNVTSPHDNSQSQPG
jgi:hypothetical protein